MTWVLRLPYSAPPLSLNKKLHWSAEYKWKQQIQSDVLNMARYVRLPKGLSRVEIVLHWAPSVRRDRDTDNPTLTLKPAIDALIRYGLCADDSHEYVSSRCVIEPIAKPSQVWLSVTDLSQEPDAA